MSKILIYLEPNNAGLKRVSYELITAALKISSDVSGVLIGGNESQAKTASEYGLKNVYLINFNGDNVYSSTQHTAILIRLINANSFDTVLFSANATGLE